MNIDKANNIAYVEGKAYHLIPVEDEEVLICEIDGKKYYLGPESDKKMDWDDAKVWAKDVGGFLMPREVAIITFKKDEVRKHFQKDDWYWLNEEYGSSCAWVQNFYSGYQLNGYYKTDANFVRAIFVE